MGSKENDLLYGGAYSIKDYYMESGNPKQMRGASELLSESAEELKRILLSDCISDGIVEEHIIVSGASLSALVPLGKGNEYVEKAESIFRKNCRTASAAFVTVECSEDNYKLAKRQAEAKYESRRAAKFTSWRYQNSNEEVNEKTIDYKDLQDESIKEELTQLRIPTRCPRCRIRTPRYYVPDNPVDEQFLCTSCAQRVSQSKKERFHRKLECGEACGVEFDKKSMDIKTMEDLGDKKGRVALLYADINNLGGQEEKDSFAKDREFHSNVESLVKDAVHKAIIKALETGDYRDRKSGLLEAKFEIITLAGDDICLLLPGNVALLTAKTITDIFSKNNLGLTISVAVCVANDTTPLTYMERLVDHALDKAKKHDQVDKSSIVNLSFFEQPSMLFPMTASELDRFTSMLKESSSLAVTAMRSIAAARRDMVFDEEFTLFLDYHLSRDLFRNNRQTLDDIRKGYPGKNPWPDFVVWRNQLLDKEVSGD